MYDEQHTTNDTTGAGTGPLMRVEHVDFWYGDTKALHDVSLDIGHRECVVFMGPSGCGKTTLLKCLNRMQEEERDVRLAGRILLDGTDIMHPDIDPPMLRRNFGWVAQKPDPFPDSVHENVAYGARIHGLVEDGAPLDAHVRTCLERAGLWDEVADRLDEPGTELSGGQQQRLCIARALSTMPRVLLMDEPCSAIDPIAAGRVEALIAALKRELTVVLITHSLAQARRLADRVAFFKLGRVLEVGPSPQIFEAPSHPETAAYLQGVFG